MSDDGKLASQPDGKSASSPDSKMASQPGGAGSGSAGQVSELELLKKKVDEYLNGWKRAKADYINLKREYGKREQEMVQFANAALILEMLPIYDNFKLAWQHIPEEHRKNDEWLKGIEHIKNQFKGLLKDIGIEEIKTVGEKFNPEFHEAVAKEKADAKESGTVIAEIKGGYKLYDKVLEHAKVKVAE